MKCKMCGAELKKDGDLCNNCMNKILKQEMAKEDKQKVYEIKGTFSTIYQMSQHFESMFIAVVVIALFALYASTYIIPCVIAIILILLFISFEFLYDRYKIRKTKCTFYVTKFSMKKISFFRKKEFEITYDLVKDVAYSQTWFQKKCKVGTIRIRTKSPNIFEKNIYLDSIKNVEQVFNEIKDLFGDQEKN